MPVVVGDRGDLCQLLRRQGFIEDPAPSFLAFGLATAEALPGRMFAEGKNGVRIGVRFTYPIVGPRS